MDFPSLPKWWSDADINRRQSQCCVSLGDSRVPCPNGWGMEHRAWGEGGRGQERLAPGETVKGGEKPCAGKEGEAKAQGLKWVKWNEARCPDDFWTGMEKTGCHTHHQPHGNELEHRPVSLGYPLFQHIVRHWPAGGTELSHLPDEILALHERPPMIKARQKSPEPEQCIVSAKHCALAACSKFPSPRYLLYSLIPSLTTSQDPTETPPHGSNAF